MTKNVIEDDLNLNLWEMGYKNKLWMEQTHNICLLAKFLYCNIEPSGSVKIVVTYIVSYNWLAGKLIVFQISESIFIQTAFIILNC